MSANKARGLIKPGWFPDAPDGYPPLTLLVTTETSDSHWALVAYIVRLAEDDTPRNLTGHPVDDLVLQAQADRDGYEPGRIYAYRVCKRGFSIDDLEDLEASVRAIKTIGRRVDKYLDPLANDFGDYFTAVAKAIGDEDILFYLDRRSMYSDSTYERVSKAEAVARIEQSAKEAIK